MKFLRTPFFCRTHPVTASGDIRHRMRIIFQGQQLLLRLVTFIGYCFKFGSLSHFFTKCYTDYRKTTKRNERLLQDASDFLLQIVTVSLQDVTGLPNATVLLQNAIVISKCNAYYKICRYTLINQYIIH